MSENSSETNLPTKSVAEKKVGFARPTLVIPPRSETHVKVSSEDNKDVPVTFARKPSQFMFDHMNELRDLTYSTAKTSLGLGEKFAYWIYNKVKTLSKKWFTHCFLTIILVMYTIGGAFLFKAIEEPYEGAVEAPDIRKLRYELIEEVTNLSRLMPLHNETEQWMILANERINDFFLQVIDKHKVESFIKANRGPKVWTVWNTIVFCGTIYTTIGYGHMFPKTNTGRALTIVYAIIGIPLFLIALTDFGKLITRGIKFLWSYVRRLYYTGSCRSVRRNSGVDDIFKGAQMVYDYATSFGGENKVVSAQPGSQPQQTTSPPNTPAISNFEIDDEFNLPISVALFILLAYIFCGAVMYMVIEKWSFFEAFYFVFISMSTIGFGDYVPRDPIFMISSIIYLVFGLALMSMCINVVQAKLSDTFKQASAKIGATIGLEVDENGSVTTCTPEEITVTEINEKQ